MTWNFNPTCPQCGANLEIEWDGVEPKGDDRLLCPVHGDVGSLQDLRTKIAETYRDNIGADRIEDVREIIRKTLGS